MYLSAGLPSRHREILTFSKQEENDWQQFLLPAGYSDRLEARVSQIVDLDWGNSIHHMSQITTNKVPHKVFAGKTILCLSPQFVLRSKGKKVRALLSAHMSMCH